MIKATLQYSFGVDVANMVLGHYRRSVWRKYKSYNLDAFWDGPITLISVPNYIDQGAVVIVASRNTRYIAVMDYKYGIKNQVKLGTDEVPIECSANGKYLILGINECRRLRYRRLTNDSLSPIPSMDIELGWTCFRILNHRYAMGSTDNNIILFDIEKRTEIQRIQCTPCNWFTVPYIQTSAIRCHFHLTTCDDVTRYSWNEELQQFINVPECACVNIENSPLPRPFSPKDRFSQVRLDSPCTELPTVACSWRVAKFHKIKPRSKLAVTSYIIAPVKTEVYSAVECGHHTVVTAVAASPIRIRFYRAPGM